MQRVGMHLKMRGDNSTNSQQLFISQKHKCINQKINAKQSELIAAKEKAKEH